MVLPESGRMVGVLGTPEKSPRTVSKRVPSLLRVTSRCWLKLNAKTASAPPSTSRQDRSEAGTSADIPSSSPVNVKRRLVTSLALWADAKVSLLDATGTYSTSVPEFIVRLFGSYA